MKAILTPQVPHRDFTVSYSAEGDILTAEVDGVVDTFDFTGMPDGRAESIESATLPINPVLGAEKVNGVLTVTLAHYVAPRPEREEYVAEDENGEEVVTFETEEDFQFRLDEWEASKKRREVTL